MPWLIERPTEMQAAGDPPKTIQEFVGRLNTGHTELSVARMVSPGGWSEPGQRPDFLEVTVVLRGRVELWWIVLGLLAACTHDVQPFGGGGPDGEGLAAEAIAVGRDHACALSDGTIRCWGDGSTGQLGVPGLERSSRPVPVSGDRWVAVAAGAQHTCAIRDDATLHCWGGNERGQCGQLGGPVEAPMRVRVDGVVRIALGGATTCAVTGDGAVRCFGANDAGQLGRGVAEAGSFPDPEPVLGGVTGDVTLSVGPAHACAILEGGALLCWGDDEDGSLGLGVAGGGVQATPQPVPGEWSAVAVGASHTCALDRDGAPHCWGDPSVGALGMRVDDPVREPLDVLTDLRFVALFAGHDVTCGAEAGGGLHCAGDNRGGRLGQPDDRGPWYAFEPALDGGTQIGMGERYACATGTGRVVRCAGEGPDGQLGSDTASRPAFAAVEP